MILYLHYYTYIMKTLPYNDKNKTMDVPYIISTE